MSSEIMNEPKILDLEVLQAERESINQEAAHPLYDDTDRQILSAIEDARETGLTVTAKIARDTDILDSKVARARFELTEKAKGDTIDLRVERDRVIDGIMAVYKSQMEDIASEEQADLAELEMVERQSRKFLKACDRVNNNIEKGIAFQENEHEKLTAEIEQASSQLEQILLDIASVQEGLRQKEAEHSAILSDIEATEEIAEEYREQLVNLKKESVEVTNTQNRDQKELEKVDSRELTEEVLSQIMAEALRIDETADMQRAEIQSHIGSINQEIKLCNIKNEKRDKEMTVLHNMIVMYRAVLAGFHETADELQDTLASYKLLKEKLAEAAIILKDHRRILDEISKGNIKTIESIPLPLMELAQVVIGDRDPLELDELDKAVINTETRHQPNVQFAATIPSERSVFSISVPAELMPMVHMSRVALQTATGIQPISNTTPDGLLLHEKVAEFADNISALMSFVNNNIREPLPEVVSYIPKGILKSGRSVRLIANNELEG